MVTAIVNHPKAAELDLGARIRLISTGGAPMPVELIHKVKDMGIFFTEGWGMSLMQFSDSLSNVLFVENAVLWLSGNSDLLSIKTRAATEGRLDRIQSPVVRSRLMLGVEVLNVVVIPLVVVLFGLLWTMRRKEKNAS